MKKIELNSTVAYSINDNIPKVLENFFVFFRRGTIPSRFFAGDVIDFKSLYVAPDTFEAIKKRK